jgi:hypothetical protein
MTLVCRYQGSKPDMRIRYRLPKVPSMTYLKPPLSERPGG